MLHILMKSQWSLLLQTVRLQNLHHPLNL
uniref:Uncharacterized protein n=1 Tax=Anguilla anguilla TaxID=7936 RepID=A0A0E9PCZ9_ANGAN